MPSAPSKLEIMTGCVSSLRVLKSLRKIEYVELIALFFVNGMGMGIWFVPLGSVLDTHGLNGIKAYAFATSALAAFISPLIFGAMADRHVSPVKVLRGLVSATAVTMALVAAGIDAGWNLWLILVLIQLNALCMAPTFSLTTSIVLSRLKSSQREFGPVRSAATLGWMCGLWMVSSLGADASTAALYISAAAYFGMGVFTLFIPGVPPPKNIGRSTWKQRFGWDALALLKNRDHRVVFITAALFNIPLCAFYPYTPPQLKQLGFQHPSGWMSLGQTTELLAMFLLAGLFLRWRLKWIFVAGLTFGVLRFAFCALNTPVWLVVGILLHGCSYTLVYVTSQIYLDERIDTAWRARAQALFTLMTSGFGNLIGYLGTGWWFAASTGVAGPRYPLFWMGLSAAVGCILIYFLVAYRGQKMKSGTA